MSPPGMSSNTFALDVRVLECKNCGAPMTAPVAGGQVQCEYCGTVAQVAPRRDLHAAVIAPQAAQQMATAQAAQQRLFLLHQQAVTYDAVNNPYAFYRAPPGLEGVASQVLSKGRKDPGVTQLVQTEFRKALAAAEASPADPLAQRRCYWLAMMMAQIWASQDQFLRQRASLESALEVLHDSGHRYILNTEMAKAARNLGDLDSAEAWLAQCDPEPWNLDLDGAYRTTAATVALLRQRWDQALSLVGRSPAEIPFEPSRKMVAGIIRAAALEGAGDQAGAEQVLIAVAGENGRSDVQSTLESNDSVAVARATWERLAARNALPRGPVKVGRVMVKGCSAAGIVGAILVVALVVLSIVFMPVCGVGCGACFGYQDAVMQQLRSCPAAQQALGDDIGPAYTGLSCGNAEIENSRGNASWSMPVKGSRARGTYQFTVTKFGGPWQVQTAVLTVEGRTIDVRNCAQPVPIPGVPATPMPLAPATPPTPPVPTPPAAGGSACQRMNACCAAASSSNPTVGALCGSMGQVQSSPAAELVCQRYLESAQRALGAGGGTVPPQCQ